MTESMPDALDQVMNQLFRLRGILDPSAVATGLGMSVSEALALGFLTGGQVAQQDLGTYLSLEKSTVSRLVDALVRKGFVATQRDGRYRTITLTADGTKAACDVRAAVRRRHASMLAALTPAEHSAVALAVPALIRVLAEQPDAPPDQVA